MSQFALIYYENFQATYAYCESVIVVHCPYRMHSIHLHYSVLPPLLLNFLVGSSSSRILLNVSFQRKCSFLGDRAWWDIENVFLHSKINPQTCPDGRSFAM